MRASERERENEKYIYLRVCFFFHPLLLEIEVRENQTINPVQWIDLSDKKE